MPAPWHSSRLWELWMWRKWGAMEDHVPQCTMRPKPQTRGSQSGQRGPAHSKDGLLEGPCAASRLPPPREGAASTSSEDLGGFPASFLHLAGQDMGPQLSSKQPRLLLPAGPTPSSQVS